MNVTEGIENISWSNLKFNKVCLMGASPSSYFNGYVAESKENLYSYQMRITTEECRAGRYPELRSTTKYNGNATKN